MTRVSGTNIIKAPCCGALLATPAYSSINFTAWEYWTDGYTHGSLAPGGEWLRRCLCGRCFLLGSAERVRTIRERRPLAPDGWENRKDNWWSRFLGRETRQEIMDRYDIRPPSEIEAEQRSIPASPKYVADSELRALIDSDVADLQITKVARRLYWRHLNQPFREVYRTFREAHKEEAGPDGNSATFPDYLPSPEQTSNMEQLVKLLETAADPDWLELAELYRELGDMDAARTALSHIAGEQQRLHFVIDKLVSLNVRAPVRFFY
jgi:hypothetical protein